ncbi:hypothetical protein ACFL6Q_00555 [Candidatus Neomarinimicrobiota bacterium]
MKSMNMIGGARLRSESMKGSIWRYALSILMVSIALEPMMLSSGSCAYGLTEMPLKKKKGIIYHLFGYDKENAPLSTWITVDEKKEGASAYIDSSGRFVVEEWPAFVWVHRWSYSGIISGSFRLDDIRLILWGDIPEESFNDSARVKEIGENQVELRVRISGVQKTDLAKRSYRRIFGIKKYTWVP